MFYGIITIYTKSISYYFCITYVIINIFSIVLEYSYMKANYIGYPIKYISQLFRDLLSIHRGFNDN